MKNINKNQKKVPENLNLSGLLFVFIFLYLSFGFFVSFVGGWVLVGGQKKRQMFNEKSAGGENELDEDRNFLNNTAVEKASRIVFTVGGIYTK